MKLDPSHYTPFPSTNARGPLDDLERRLTGASDTPPPSLAELIREALDTLAGAGIELERLELDNGRWNRPKHQDHLWYRAESGTGTSGRPWLMVTAGNLRETGDPHQSSVVYKSWTIERASGSTAPEERAEIERQLERARIDREASEAQRREDGRAKALALWEGATEAVNGHGYLASKGIGAHGIRRSGSELLIPLQDHQGGLHGLQRIAPDGGKRFTAGADVTGHYHLIGNLDQDPAARLLLCEGYATGATLHEITGEPTAVAFNCGNLEAVAKALRANNPDRAIVVCGDDDRHTQGNPGRTHAERAAAAVGGSVAFPVFTDRHSTGTDFNDLAREEGPEAVRRLVAVPKTPRQPAPLVTKASDFRPEPIRWIWEGWLAAGKVHICAGPPGTGKTSVAMALAATITQGGRWPDNTWAAPADVVVWSGEDDPTDTLVPRLMAAGADLERVHIVSGYQDEDGERRAFDPGRDARALADHIGRMDPAPALLIVDPIVSAVSGDSHKNAEVRRALQPLVDLGMTQRCAVLGVTHFSKGSSGRDPVERVTGSLAFGALARVVMVAAKRPDEEGGGRLLARGKSNIGPDSGGFGYDLEVCTVGDGIQTTRVLWREALQGSARELLSQAETQDDPEERNQTQEAMDWLQDYLSTGPAKAKDVQRDARECGISEKALRTARERLGVKPTKSGFQGGYRWALPGKSGPMMPTPPNDDPICQVEKQGSIEAQGHHWDDLGNIGKHESTDFDPSDVEAF